MERAAKEGLGKLGGESPDFTFSPGGDGGENGGDGGDSTSSLHHPKPALHHNSTNSTSFSTTNGGGEIIPKNWVFPDPFSPPVETVEVVERLVIACKKSGYSQTQTILMVWGIEKSGSDPRYKAARESYQKIVERLEASSQNNYHINLTQLVKVALIDCRLLPARAGVYFVVDSNFNCYYIGSSRNIMLRWNFEGKPHHRMTQFERLNQATPLYILSYPCENYEDEEDRAIAHFKPELNGTAAIP
jgi:hypothetical protein